MVACQLWTRVWDFESGKLKSQEQAVILHRFHDFRTCTVIGDYEDSISDLKDWSESHEGKILVTKPSIYLTGASYAVYEGIGNAEKVLKHNFFITNMQCTRLGTTTFVFDFRLNLKILL